MKDSILILSGGMDSTTLLYDYQERIALAISFDYGSKHNDREIAFAREHCQKLGIEHLIIPLQFMAQYFITSSYFTRLGQPVRKGCITVNGRAFERPRSISDPNEKESS